MLMFRARLLPRASFITKCLLKLLIFNTKFKGIICVCTQLAGIAGIGEQKAYGYKITPVLHPR